MQDSILQDTKRQLGIRETDTSFNPDMILMINSVFSVVKQLGIGPEVAFVIENEDAVWSDFKTTENEELPVDQMSMLKTYIALKIRLLFDPPQTSFLKDAIEEQIKEHEVRLSFLREGTIPIPEPVVEEVWCPTW